MAGAGSGSLCAVRIGGPVAPTTGFDGCDIQPPGSRLCTSGIRAHRRDRSARESSSEVPFPNSFRETVFSSQLAPRRRETVSRLDHRQAYSSAEWISHTNERPFCPL